MHHSAPLNRSIFPESLAPDHNVIGKRVIGSALPIILVRVYYDTDLSEISAMEHTVHIATPDIKTPCLDKEKREEPVIVASSTSQTDELRRVFCKIRIIVIFFNCI